MRTLKLSSAMLLLLMSISIHDDADAQALISGIADNETLYQSAVTDAMVADSSEICDTLWAITPQNKSLTWKTINGIPHVLMGCFTRFPGTFKDSIVNFKWGILWVFIPQQFQSRMKNSLKKDSDTLLRMRQLLGLPPENTNTHVAEFWVNPDDLFRPSADPETVDRKAGLYLRSDDEEATHRNWFLWNIYTSYFSDVVHYPWTRLGYTYDWALNASEVGVSEYCLKNHSVLYTNRVMKAELYVR